VGAEVRVLGPLEVFNGAREVPVGGARERRLLAALAVRPGDALSADQLVDALWRERPPRSAAKQLQNHVVRVRKALGADAIRTTQAGYALGDEIDVDAVRFESCVREARAAVGRGDQRESVPLFAGALGMWRGRTFVELEGWDGATAEVARLEELRRSAEEEAIDARLALGAATESVADAEALVAAEPLREHRWVQLMRVLYRTGRQADALRAYQRARETLARELGIEPGSELRATEQAVLAQDEALGATAREANRVVGLHRRGLQLVPLPRRLASEASVTPGFVGRSREVEVFRDAVKRVDAGERQVVLVSGEPGVGKTALAAYVGSECHARGAAVLYGRCDEEMVVPYQPFAEAIGHYVKRTGLDGLESQFTDLKSFVRPGATGREVLDDQEADSQRYRMFAAVVDLLASASSDAMVVVVLDDLQWADRPTLSLLRHVSSASLDRVLVVGTYRASDLSRIHPLADTLVALQRESGIVRLDLSGLDDVDTVELFSSMTGYQLDQGGVSFAHALRQETDGNPFFTIELLRHLADTGALRRDESTGGWAASDDLTVEGLPRSVRQLIGQRVEHLGPDARRLLSTAAVIGPEFDLSLLCRVADSHEEETLELLEHAGDAGLVIELQNQADCFEFHHALVQHTLYRELSASRRTRLHRDVADAIEAAYGNDPSPRIAELARHLLAATQTVDVERAIKYARRAGDQALEQLAPDEAKRWYAQALELLDQHGGGEDAQRCDLLISLGLAQRRSGDPAHRDGLLKAAAIAQRSTDIDRLVRAALANNRGIYSASMRVDEERIEVLETALEAISPDDSSERARLLAILAVELSYSAAWERRQRLANEAIDVARRLGDPRTLARVLALAFHACYAPSTLDQRLAWSAEALEVTEAIDDPLSRSSALDQRMWACFEAGRIGELDARLAEHERIASELSEPHLLFNAAFVSALRRTISGSIDDAQRATDAFLAAAPPGYPDAPSIWSTLVLGVQIRRGELPELIPTIEQATREFPDIDAVRAALAYAYLGTDHREQARKALDREQQRGFDKVNYDRSWLGTICAWATVAAGLGDSDAAAQITAMLEPYPDHLVLPDHPTGQGAVSHHLGSLGIVFGHHEQAERYLNQADALYQRIGATFWPELNTLTRAELLIARRQPGDAQRAGVLLDDLTERAHAQGYRGVVRDAAVLREQVPAS
jgi:DNA-binding SARP family transcriptional activator